MALIGLGYRSISMSPAAIGPVKSMLLALDVKELEDLLLPALDENDPQYTIRKLLADFADTNGIPL